MSHEPYPGTQAVLRAIALLKTFSDDQPEWGLTELAEAAGLNKTTAYRLLTALESEGLLARTEGADTYRLGPEMIVLGGRALRTNDLRQASRPELAALAQQTRETVTLEALVDRHILILEELSGAYLVGAVSEIGTRWPAHATSTGKMLLACLPAAELERYLETPLEPLTERTVTSPEALRRELSQFCRQGYATAVEELERGYVALSAPVYNFEGRAVAAVSIGGPALRLTPERVRELAEWVKAAAGRISARLGYR